MYNSDGTLRRIKTDRASSGRSSVNLSWEAEASKENNGVTTNSPKGSPVAAGRKTKVTHINGHESPLKPRQRPGSDARARDNMSHLNEDNTCLPHKISDAKKKALFESHIFNTGAVTPEHHANELSKMKMEEVAGHDIFNLTEEPQVERRNVLGGVRKEPGGGSSLRMDNLHPSTPVPPISAKT